jgi:xanthosine utilization system XapX-like protein
MSTPVKPSGSSVPAVPAAPATPLEPVPVLAPFGWTLILSSGIGLILATWLLYPIDYDGMWAGYRDGIIATVVVLAAMALTVSLPKRPILALLGLCGILLVLFGIFLDNPTKVLIAETVAGAVLLAGTALYASGNRS